jgi:hypothetical protein
VGYESLFAIISNLGAIIAYWTIIYFAIILEEAIIFRRSRGWNLEGWDNPKLLPAGYAAMLAFWIGVAGSIVGMGQTVRLISYQISTTLKRIRGLKLSWNRCLKKNLDNGSRTRLQPP